MTSPTFEDLLRELAPQVLAALVRRYGDFDECEDAVQEALLAAFTHWPQDGVPQNPRAWLAQTASRKLLDIYRNEQARRRRENLAAHAQSPLVHEPPQHDDTLAVLLMCCHPALTPASAIALTLRAVGGLTTAEIAAAFLVPEATMAQRISRAKQRLKTSAVGFSLPGPAERAVRFRPVLHVLYLIFNEGYAASAGENLHRTDLTAEAIRLTRMVHRMLPDDGEVAGLLALMLLTDARRDARTDGHGDVVPLDEQDRSTWDKALIAEGTALLDATFTRAAPTGAAVARAASTGAAVGFARAGSTGAAGAASAGAAVGEYRLQAAIAALHCRAPSFKQTDWPQIAGLYSVLERLTANPVVALNKAIADAMVHGPAEGLRQLDDLGDRLGGHHRLDAVRAHLFEMGGDMAGAAHHYRTAAARTASLPEQRYLLAKASHCQPVAPTPNRAAAA